MGNILTDILNLLLPHHCSICGSRLNENENSICLACLMDLPRTNAHLMDENPIEKLFWTHLPIERATSFMFHEGQNSRLSIYKTKYYGRPEVGKALARIMARELMDTDFFDGIDIIIPIPLHWRRQMSRGFNQSDYIAEGISEVTGIKVDKSIVKRANYTEKQALKHLEERKRNVEGAFRLVHPEKVSGKHVLLVDDVITTGSTTIECGKEICKNNDVKISIISLNYAGEKFTSVQANMEDD